MIYRNPEHYQDPTAGEAIENLEREGWEYSKVRHAMIQRESAELIRKMKQRGTWPGQKQQKSVKPQNAAAAGPDDKPWRLVWGGSPMSKGL